ncbi:hypothetical protein ACO2Q3_19330 [Caulobacter sp. KR2-114]|uniref:hypothetical protein n=1 Tax=Caulobacter sp. KR2-114 TaxID=3400912 RepID=UPI003C0C77DE
MKRLVTISTLMASMAFASAAFAAEGGDQPSTSTSTVGPMPVTGNVPAICSSGAISGGDNVFGVGVLIDTGTGLLLQNLTAPPKTIGASFCNSRSTITVSATPLVAQNFTDTAPTNFSKSVDFTATASGWTDTAAVTNTGAAQNPNATQTRTTPFTGPITVTVSNFTTTGGSNLLMVADTNYQGTVTVTLAVAS